MRLIIGIGVVIVAVVFLVAGVPPLQSRRPVPPKADPGKVRIVCIGDSITYGMGVLYGGRERKVWTTLLGRQLGEEYQVLNYGISGATLQSEGDLPYRSFPQLEKAKEAQAQVYLLMLGTNDSKPYNWNAGRFEKELGEWVDELQAGEWPHRVLLMTPPCAFPARGKSEVGFDISAEVIRDEVRPIVLRTAAEKRIDVVDLYSQTEDNPSWFGDGVHPNTEGNRHLAQIICDALEKIR